MLVGAEMEGQKAPAEEIKKTETSLTFTGGKYTAKMGDKVVEEGTYTTGSAGKAKTVDFMIRVGKDKGKKQLGIYKLEGDTLTMSMSAAGAPNRPAGFVSKKGSGMEVSTLERKKD